MSLGEIIGYTGMIVGATSFVGSFIGHIACRGSEPAYAYIGTGGLIAIMAFGAIAGLSGEPSSSTDSPAGGGFPGHHVYDLDDKYNYDRGRKTTNSDDD